MGLLLKGAEAVVIKDMEKAKVLNATCNLVFPGKTILHKP